MTELTETLKQLSVLGQETRLLAFGVLMEAGLEGMPVGSIAEQLHVQLF
ncbi:MAG: hypothetical protein VYC38_07480 [Pseudomonadota bacterium]|nr:hypothetical protein [Pseudomonadota bacterium]